MARGGTVVLCSIKIWGPGDPDMLQLRWIRGRLLMMKTPA